MIFNRNIYLFIVSTFLTVFSYTQTSICLGEDVTVCAGSPVQINDCGGYGTGPLVSTEPYIQELIPFAPNPFAGTQVSLSDDSQTGALPIGFSFCFFGVDYTQFYIGSNGWIAFTPQSTSYTSATIPSTLANVPKNCIMAPWQDWHPGVGSNVGNYIRYQTLGTAPNRKLVVSWNQIPFFSCTTVLGTFQIVIYETTNIIETHITNKPACLTWAGGTATHGVHNAAGTVAFVIPGRNSTQWTVTNEGRRFSPTIQYEWGNTLGQTFPYNGGVLNIPSANNGTVGYFLNYTSSTCATVSGTASDTSWVTGVNASVTISSTPDICSSGIGTATANPSGTPPFSYFWPTAGGAMTQTVTGLSAGTYQVQLTDGMGCTASASVTIGDTPASYSSASTIVSCFNGNDGTATATMIPELGNVSYLWNDPLAQTTQTAVGLSAGTYTCTVSSDIGCSNDVSVTVTEIPQMIANFTTVSDATCNSGNDGVLTVNVTLGTSPYTYSWDNSTSTSATANDLPAGDHIVTITDSNGCVITHQGTIGEPDPLNISNLTPDTQICPEDEILLTVTGTGGSSPYLFTWYENDLMIGTGTSITVDPDDSGTVYKVVLSEECNSPKDSATLIITFPTPIDPIYTPNQLVDCVVGEFEFTNNSTNREEIASTFIDFGDLNTTIELGYDSTSHAYNRVGTYTMSVIVTSIYGCIYEKTFEDIVTVQPVPDADFVFSANPSFSFDNSVTLTDMSSVDVIDWQWFAPSLSPTSSNEDNPTFNYPIDVEGMYPITLVVTSYLGCTDTVTLNLTVQDELLLYAPNSFTPNGDEYNNYWNVVVKGISTTNYNLMIFNRWGEMIFESNDPTIGWDGTYNGRIVETGTYVWKASMRKENNDGKIEFNGFINLLK